MKYIFINPVVDKMYKREGLDSVLLHNGYSRIEVKEDWHSIVKEKYNELLKETNLTVIDKRCPKAIDLITPYLDNEKMLVPSIDPILIHCAVELANREDLKNLKKVITTPCDSLADYGNKMGLEDTEFISWKRFLEKLNIEGKLELNTLEASPIPPGYFKSLDAKVTSLSEEENIENHFKNELYLKDDLVEMLYCFNGCHNGDGVLINEQE